MANSKIEDNFIRTALASDGVSSTEPLRVDPVTSRLLIDVEVTTSTIPAALNGKIDDNYTRTAFAVTDDVAETQTPLIIDNRNGYIFIDVLTE